MQNITQGKHFKASRLESWGVKYIIDEKYALPIDNPQTVQQGADVTEYLPCPSSPHPSTSSAAMKSRSFHEERHLNPTCHVFHGDSVQHVFILRWSKVLLPKLHQGEVAQSAVAAACREALPTQASQAEKCSRENIENKHGRSQRSGIAGSVPGYGQVKGGDGLQQKQEEKLPNAMRQFQERFLP